MQMNLLNLLRGKINPDKQSHVWYATSVLVLSAVLYLIFLCIALNNTGDGGGQPTLPGWGKIIAMMTVVAVLIFGSLQWLMFRFIRKRVHIPPLTLLLPLPVILLLPLGISALNLPDAVMPDNYGRIVFYQLILSDILFYCAFRLRYRAAIGAALIHATGIFVFALYCVHLKSGYDGRVRLAIAARYAQQQHEEKKPYSDLAPRVDANGTAISENRYRDIPHHKPDSEIYYYTNGWVMARVFFYDSAGAEYQREAWYEEYGKPRSRRLENHTTRTNMEQHYFPDTPAVDRYEIVYDSSNRRYKREIFYTRKGEIKRQKLQRLHAVKPNSPVLKSRPDTSKNLMQK